MLHYYSKLLGAGLEIIPWSDLPVSPKDRGDFSRDPNTRVFRAGAYAAINDCLLRSRYPRSSNWAKKDVFFQMEREISRHVGCR